MNPQTFASEFTENGKYQITRYNIIEDRYVPIKGEVYLIESIALNAPESLTK